MTFFDAGHHSKIELTQEEMLTISREISLKFSANTALVIENEGLFAEFHSNYTYPQIDDDIADIDLELIEGINYRFSAKELNTISEEISRNFAPKASILEPELFLLPVDPYHLYAYWDIGDNSSNKLLENQPLTLRVYWRPDANPDIKHSNVWFDFTTDQFDSRLKVRLPLDDSAYSASLGKLNQDHSFDVLACSNIIHVPTAPERTRITPFQHNQDHPLPDADSEIARVSPNPATQIRNEIFDEAALIDNKIQGIFYEKQKQGTHFQEQGWFVKLHFSHPSAHEADITKIDSQLMNIFKQKGINVELIPEPDFVESSIIHSKSASGWGI